MLEQLIRPEVLSCITMLAITVLFATLFLWPMTRFPRKDKLVNFYWAGFWMFLGMICAMSGAQVALLMIGQNVQQFGDALLGALTITFVMFVVFGWGRLVLYGAQSLARRALKSN